MERISHITHRETEVIRVDLSGLREVSEMERIARAGSAVIRTRPPASVRVLIDLSGTPYSLRALRVLSEIGAANAPHLRARAVVGLPEAVRPVVRSVSQYTGTPTRAFGSPEEALEWLGSI